MPPRNRSAWNDDRQLRLLLDRFNNRELFSNHWLDHRLLLEPEWSDLHADARHALDRLLDLWRREKDRVALYGDEAGLEEKFIQPVFEILGWRLKYQAYVHGREADYALFVDDAHLEEALRAGRLNPDFWSHAMLVADAKAWHVNLDRPTRVDRKREYPPEQIEWYLNHSLRDYGVLTNGRLWRLVPRLVGPTKPRFQTYLEVDLPALLDSFLSTQSQLQLGPAGHALDTFFKFYLFFGPAAFSPPPGRKPLITRAIEGSSEYSLGVGEELKERVFEALRLCTEGFVKHQPNNLNPLTDLALCHEHSFIFLYRLLFILFAEDRSMLPYRSNEMYTRNRSLARHRDDVAGKLDNLSRRLDRQDYSNTETNLWNDLKTLFDLVDRGGRRYGVPEYNGGLFDLEADEFLSTKSLTDSYVARIIDQLGRAPQPDHPERGLFRVDYRDLAIQQLGSVYEGLLELTPRYASEVMRVVRKTRGGGRTERVIPARDLLPQGFEHTDIAYGPGEVYLATDKGERRSSGSYYTPDHIVDHIVERAVGGLCRELDRAIQNQIEACRGELADAPASEHNRLEGRLRELEGSFDERVLSLKILDPAMGSGHFLIRACQRLAEEIATSPFTRDPVSDEMGTDETTITYWKRRVAETCVYGVDANPFAVELAKLALWLETAAPDTPLTFLNHHFRHGDSIIGARVKALSSLPGESGVLRGEFSQELDRALPTLMQPLIAIRAMPSDTAAQVRQKEQLFRRRFLPALSRFTTIADLWCAVATSNEISVDRDQYADALRALGVPRQFAAITESEWFERALRELSERHISPFHWDLSFPEVFHRQDGATAGFDAIVGNPPYDVLSELEVGHNISHLKRFIDVDVTLHPSKVGKNNLYKLFICRAVELLKESGQLGFIVPMPLLGDEQARGVRQMLLSSGDFTEIHAFPQKDDRTRRVFPDAKLSTAVFIYQRLDVARRGVGRFTSQVHPAQFVEPGSPALTLDRRSLSLYDPVNLTIVSCSQDDWDLATRILSRPGIGRLGQYSVSFQGEVNETNEKNHAHILHSTADIGRQLVLRGANVCMYILRDASQGEDVFIDGSKFLENKSPDSKPFHSRLARVGFQRSSPQNNYRRLIAALVPPNEFCFDTISYIPASSSRLSSDLLLGLLNSKLLDWYFRLGSTNSKVNEYQFNHLPCPVFRQERHPGDGDIEGRVVHAVDHDLEAVPEIIAPLCANGPFSPVVRESIELLVRRIREAEGQRGIITRTERARLSEVAQPYQNALDQIVFALAGLDMREFRGIEERLKHML